MLHPENWAIEASQFEVRFKETRLTDVCRKAFHNIGAHSNMNGGWKQSAYWRP